MVSAIALQQLDGKNLMLIAHWSVSPQQALKETASFSEKISKIRNERESVNRKLVQIIRAGTFILNDHYRVQYFLLNEIYIAIFFPKDGNPFLGELPLKKTQELLVRVCKGVEVTATQIEKKYAEIYLALNNILDGTDVTVDITTVSRLSDISTAIHKSYSLSPITLRTPVSLAEQTKYGLEKLKISREGSGSLFESLISLDNPASLFSNPSMEDFGVAFNYDKQPTNEQKKKNLDTS